MLWRGLILSYKSVGSTACVLLSTLGRLYPDGAHPLWTHRVGALPTIDDSVESGISPLISLVKGRYVLETDCLDGDVSNLCLEKVPV